MYVIYHDQLGGFIEKTGGWNIAHQNPRWATRFKTREDAMRNRPGHSRDMGGAGPSGAVMTYEEASRRYLADVVNAC